MNITDRSFEILPATKAAGSVTFGSDDAAALNNIFIGITGSSGQHLILGATSGFPHH